MDAKTRFILSRGWGGGEGDDDYCSLTLTLAYSSCLETQETDLDRVPVGVDMINIVATWRCSIG